MSWVKLDDRFPDNPKIAKLSDSAVVAYVFGICYCARELTDGLIPAKRAQQFAGKRKTLLELTPELWELTPDGFLVHDYLKYNPTRSQVLAEREAARGRKFGKSSGEPQANSGQSSDAPVNPDPLPIPVTKSKAPPPAPIRAEGPLVFRCYEQLFGVGRINEFIREDLLEVDAGWNDECIQHCFEEAARAGARSWKLVKTILDRHKAEGCYGGNSTGADSGKQATGNNPESVATIAERLVAEESRVISGGSSRS